MDQKQRYLPVYLKSGSILKIIYFLIIKYIMCMQALK